MIAFCWRGSSVIHFAIYLPTGCTELAHGQMDDVANAVYQTSTWDGAYFDVPGLAAALQAEDYKLAEQVRDEYSAKLRAKINELIASREMSVPT